MTAIPTPIPQLMISYLGSLSAVTSRVATRISTTLQPERGFPAILVGAVNGGPLTTPAANVDLVERWTVPLYCYAGRRDGGLGDLPDYPAAWDLASAISSELHELDFGHFETETAEIVAARIISTSPSLDSSGGYARVLLSLEVQVWRR